MELAEKSVHWRVLLNIVMGLQAAQKAESITTACATVGFLRRGFN
jgi:hypothetical protein